MVQNVASLPQNDLLHLVLPLGSWLDLAGVNRGRTDWVMVGHNKTVEGVCCVGRSPTIIQLLRICDDKIVYVIVRNYVCHAAAFLTPSVLLGRFHFGAR